MPQGSLGLKIIPPHFPYLRVVWGGLIYWVSALTLYRGAPCSIIASAFGGRGQMWGSALGEVYSLKEAPRAA